MCRRLALGPLCAALLLAGLVLASPRLAWAQIPPVQWQLLALGGVDVAAENPQGEVQINLGLAGIGLALGLGGGAHLGLEPATGGSGYADIALQIRPLMFIAYLREIHAPAYHIFDPHLDAGGLLGVLGENDNTSFLGVFYVGASFDFGIPTAYYWMQSQVLLTFGYRFVPVQTPFEGFEHYFILGIGYRGGY